MIPATETAAAATVTVTPATVTLASGATQAFTAVVAGTANQSVTWSSPGGSIASNGAFTAGLASGTYDVTATITGGTISGAAHVTITGPPLVSRYLSDVTWTSMTNGWGPVERDRSNGEMAAGDGLPLMLDGITYAKGLGTNSPSDLRYALNRACTTFSATVGVDDEVGALGSVVFQVWLDGVQRYDSGIMIGSTMAKNVSLSVAGVTELGLVVTDGGDGNPYDHGDWINALVSCTDTTPPTIVTTSPVAGATAVAANTSVTAVFSKDMTQSTFTAANVTLSPPAGAAPAAVTIAYDSPSKTLTVRPTASLTANAVYTATIKGGASGVKDLSGNALAADKTWTFTSAAGADKTPPTVSAVTPTAGATQVAVATNVTATFSEPLAPASITIASMTLAPQGGAVLAATVTYDGTTVTLHPKVSLVASKIYTATIKGGTSGVKDVAGNPLAADKVWTFTSADPADTTPPTVSSFTPATGATQVAVASNVTATFSEAMTVASITTATVTLVPQAGTAVAATVTYDATSKTVTLHPTVSLVASKIYTATVKGGTSGVKDVAGNPLAADKVWTFTSADPADTTPPTVSSFTPATGATQVAVASNVTATFSEAMTVASITTATVTLVPQAGTAVAATVTYDATSKTVTLHPTVSLVASKIYTATVKGGTSGVKDVAGNPLAADKVWSFTSADPADTTPPTISSVTPAAGATQVALATNVTGTFSEAMTAASLTTATVTLVAQGSTTPVAATVTYDVASKTVTLHPNASLAFGTSYTATVKGGGAGAKDLAGNPLSADRVWTLTTLAAPDTTPPTVSSVTPAAGAAQVAVATNVTATFSEAMTAASITAATATLAPLGGAPVAATVTYDATSKTMTLHPTVSLAASTTYTATVSGGANGAKDVAGNPLSADLVWTFTAAGPPQIVQFLSDLTWTSMTNGWGPVELDRSNGEVAAGDGLPLMLDGATYAKGLGANAPSNVTYALNGACTVFSATVGVDDEVGTQGSVVFQIWTDGVQRYDSGTMTGTTTAKTISVSMAGVTQLALTLTDSGDGNAFDHGDWVNAKVSCSDTTPPTIVVTSPLAGATGVALASDVTAVFSKDMNPATLTATNLTLVAQGSTAPLAATVSYDSPSRTLRLHPSSSLVVGTIYTATIKGGTTGVQDLSGNPLSADRVWTFTSIPAADTTPPTISSVSPAAGATLVPVAANVTSTFSEAMSAASITTATTTLVPQGGTAVAATVTYAAAGFTLTLHPTTSLAASTTFTATVKGGTAGVKDVAGNPLSADRVWTFTTAAAADTTPPTVSSVAPAASATQVAVATNVTSTFSEAMNATTFTTATVTLVAQGSTTPVPATVTYDAASKTVTLHPTANLTASTGYTATVKGGAAGVKDLAGNALAADKVWTLTTAATQFYLSDRTWTSMINGWGPVEIDHSNGENAAGDGSVLTLNGVTYTKGLGANAASDIRYPLQGVCYTFTASVGVDDEVGANGSIVFQVLVDGVKRFDSGVMTGATATANVSVDVTGASELALLVNDGGDGNAYDHGDWANALVSCDPAPITITVGTAIYPGDNIQAIVNAAANGATFTLKTGIHRMQTIRPKPGMTFIGEPGTILSGARILTSPTGSNPWAYSGQTQQGTFDDGGGEACEQGHDACGHPEDVFFDNQIKTAVSAFTDGGPGKWFFDYTAHVIYVWDNPAGHVVETSVTPTAIDTSAVTGVTIHSLIVEKFATVEHECAVILGSGSLMDTSEVRWNHHGGIENGSGSISRGNNVHHNGALGFIGSGTNILIENNEIAYNNIAFHNSFWEAGGTKWVYTDGLTVRGNFSHHNDGPGLWTDINNIRTVYENNRVEDNVRAGIIHEVSYDAIIRNNSLSRNGTAHYFPGWPTEAAIALGSSGNVEIYGNTLVDNWSDIGALQQYRDGDTPPLYGSHLVQNVYVHDNTINSKTDLGSAGVNGIVWYDPTLQANPFAASANNRWQNNSYSLGTYANYFQWSGGGTNEAGWKVFGNDVSGTFQR